MNSLTTYTNGTVAELPNNKQKKGTVVYSVVADLSDKLDYNDGLRKNKKRDGLFR